MKILSSKSPLRDDAPPAGPGLRIMLAGSGGGHIRQLLDLEPVWRQHDYRFVTEDTALGRSLAKDHPVDFVTHVAWGQARLGHPFRMIAAAFRNIIRSFAIMWRQRPDVVISTGAGAMFAIIVAARLRGAKVIVIESFARFDHPSKFGRLARPFATRTVVQAERLKAYWPEAELFDPLRILDKARPAKEALLFATVGATLPFARLVDSILALKAAGGLPERVLLQIGDDDRVLPSVDGVEIVRSLDFAEVKAVLQRAELVICHGGTGSLITALREGCRVIAMPRRFDLAEHYDNHQEEITSAFAARGLIDVVHDAGTLGAMIAQSRARPPVAATTDPAALIAWLERLLADWAGQAGRR